MGKWQKCFRSMVVGTLALLLFIPFFSAAAFAKEKDVMKNVGSFMQWNTPVTLKLDGVALPVQGHMVNSKITIPFRTVFEAMGAEVAWDEANQTATANGKGLTVTQQLGESATSINGKAYRLDSDAVIEGGNLMVAVRALPLASGAELKWDSAGRELSITIKPVSKDGMRVQSDAFQAFGDIPAKYAHNGTANGKDISLPVRWAGAPKETKSFAVVMYDLHPIADNWIHWSVINLPASVNGLEEGISGKLKEGTEVNPYFGMGPPQYSGDHQYRIVVYALDTDKVELSNQPVFFEDLEPVLKKHALAYEELDGFFKQE